MSALGYRDSQDIERFRSGYLNHMIIGKRRKTVKKRWVVFQGIAETGFYQLKIFKNDSEKVLKTAYTLTKNSYVGTERGAVQKQSDTSEPYWVVILNNDSIVFQETDGGVRNSGVDLKDWDLALKDRLTSQSWLVFQLTGFTANELHLTLHITDECISLATINPPKCYKQWKLSQLRQYKARDSVFCFLIGSTEKDEDTDNSEYYEVKAESSGLASVISSTLKSKFRNITIHIPPQTSLRRTPSDPYDRYTPSPSHSPLSKTPNDLGTSPFAVDQVFN